MGLFVASFGASALGGTMGMASGIFIVPLLTAVFHIDIHAAVAASIVSVIACSCAGAAPFLKNGFTNIRVAIVLEIATTLGALSGVALGGLVREQVLYLLFALILILSVQQMTIRRRPLVSQDAETSDLASRLGLHASYKDGAKEIRYRVQHIPLGMTFMYGAGLISALLGIGSGVLKIPAMDVALRLPLKISSATSNFMIGVTAAASGAAYCIRGDIDPAIASPIALGSVLGALLGARALVIMPVEKIRFLFIAVLSLLAIQMTLKGFGLLGGSR
jgi:hypothetical protein